MSSKMQRHAERVRKQRLAVARTELAVRYPKDRAEIMGGVWDHGSGMAQVFLDMKVLGK